MRLAIMDTNALPRGNSMRLELKERDKFFFGITIREV